MSEAIIEKDHPKIMLNDSNVDSNINPVNEKSQESADEDENGEEMEFEIPDEEISQANENGIEAIEVRTECKTEIEDGTADGTKVDKQNTTEDVNFQAKKKVVKMRGAEDYLGKNDLTKYENRKDSVTRLDNKIGKSSDQSESSDQKDLKQDSKNIKIDENKIQKSEVRESTDLENEMFYEDELDDSRMPLCKFEKFYYKQAIVILVILLSWRLKIGDNLRMLPTSCW